MAQVSYADLIAALHEFAVEKINDSREREDRYPAAALDSIVDDLKEVLDAHGIDRKRKFRMTTRELEFFVITVRFLVRDEMRIFRRKVYADKSTELVNELSTVLHERYG